MPNSRFKIVGDEFLTAMDYDDEFHVNLLFDRSIYRPMCTHMGNLLWNYVISTRESNLIENTAEEAFALRAKFLWSNFS